MGWETQCMVSRECSLAHLHRTLASFHYFGYVRSVVLPSLRQVAAGPLCDASRANCLQTAVSDVFEPV
jgi:hypothetical protein